MKEIRFPEWAERLAQTSLPEQQKRSFAVTLRWYLRFCRRAKMRPHAPVWLTRAETQALLSELDEPWALMTRVALGGGLRLMELLRLRVKDLEMEQEIITVRGGKGDKDRFVPLAHVAVESLRTHLNKVRQVFDGDRQAQLPGVALPDGLEQMGCKGCLGGLEKMYTK